MRVLSATFIVSLFVLTGCSRKPAAANDTSDRVTVAGNKVTLAPDSPRLARIQSAPVQECVVPQVELSLPGKVEANPTLVSHIALPVSGRIRRVLVDLGDTVRKGQPVLTVDSPDAATAMSTYRQAKSNIAVAKAQVAKADADLTREQDLEAHGAAAHKDVLAAVAVKVQADEALTQGQASLEEAAKRLSVLGIRPGSVIDQYVTVNSSVAGKVTEISAVGGEFRNDTNTPFITVSDLSTVWVAADLPEDQLTSVRQGDAVAITMGAYPGETFQGTIARIGDTEDPQTHTIKVRAFLQNQQGKFRPDMFATIRIRQGSLRLPVVPVVAVLQSEGRSSVFVERSRGDFEQVPVKTGWQDGDHVAITSGLQANDRVVISGGMLLRGY